MLEDEIRVAEQLYKGGDPALAAETIHRAVVAAGESNDPRLAALLRREFSYWWDAGRPADAETALRAEVDANRISEDWQHLAASLSGLAFFPGVPDVERDALANEALELAQAHGFADIQREVRFKLDMSRRAF